MIYVIKSRIPGIDDPLATLSEEPLHIKVSTRDLDNQPFIGFATEELGETFLNLKSYLDENYFVVPLGKKIYERYKNRPYIYFENEHQILEVQKNAQGYNYEILIRQNDL